MYTLPNSTAFLAQDIKSEEVGVELYKVVTSGRQGKYSTENGFRLYVCKTKIDYNSCNNQQK